MILLAIVCAFLAYWVIVFPQAMRCSMTLKKGWRLPGVALWLYLLFGVVHAIFDI